MRERLTRERVLDAGMVIADADGIAAVTIRSIATALGVKPMALYHHVDGKEAILDGLVDAVFAEIDLPVIGGPWWRELRRRCSSARSVLGRHPWAIGLMETRTSPGPATLRHLDAVIGTCRAAGFSLATTAHTIALLDAYVYGFALQEATLPFDSADQVPELATQMLAAMPEGQFPYLIEFASEHVLRPGYDFASEFDVGLDIVLDGIARLARR